MNGEYAPRYSFLQRITGVISGNREVLEDLKQNGNLTDASMALILSILGVIGVFILYSYLTFASLLNLDLPGIFEHIGIDAAAQGTIIQMITPTSLSEHLAESLWPLIAIIAGLIMLWFLSSLLIHLFAVGLKGQARLTNMLIFTAFLLPLSILFGGILLLPILAGILNMWYLFLVAIILLIISAIVLIRALIVGVSEIYSITSQGSSIVVILVTMIFIIAATAFWMVII